MTTTTKYERIARLHAVGDDDAVDPELRTVRREPDKRRITNDVDQTPAVPLRATLEAEVRRTGLAHERALEDLRRHLLSYDTTEAPR